MNTVKPCIVPCPGPIYIDIFMLLHQQFIIKPGTSSYRGQSYN